MNAANLDMPSLITTNSTLYLKSSDLDDIQESLDEDGDIDVSIITLPRSFLCLNHTHKQVRASRLIRQNVVLIRIPAEHAVQWGLNCGYK